MLIDANLPLWAHHAGFPQHAAARRWWEQQLSDCPLVGIPWPTIVTFVRLSTHPRALERPLAPPDALAVVREWLARPNVFTPVPTDRHASLFAELVAAGKASGNHVPDAHLAALAIEWGLELQSADRDFARYPGLRWRDPTESW
jgi:toxin-antitoxin system PIN domain toxin